MKNKFAESRKVMADTLKKDEGLYQTYKSNIAMKIWDCKFINASIDDCNKMADELIKLIFYSK